MKMTRRQGVYEKDIMMRYTAIREKVRSREEEEMRRR